MADSDVLTLEARRKIYELVLTCAGCHLREIQRRAGLSFGTVSYHLAYLAKMGLIIEKRDGKTTRYFPHDVAIEQNLLMLLRQKSIRAILLCLLKSPHTHQDITSTVNISPSTVTWHIKKLVAAHIVAVEPAGKYKRYSLSVPKESIMKLLIAYKKSFLDELVDGMIDVWERT